jgi:hypothetical protein
MIGLKVGMKLGASTNFKFENWWRCSFPEFARSSTFFLFKNDGLHSACPRGQEELFNGEKKKKSILAIVQPVGHSLINNVTNGEKLKWFVGKKFIGFERRRDRERRPPKQKQKKKRRISDNKQNKNKMESGREGVSHENVFQLFK